MCRPLFLALLVLLPVTGTARADQAPEAKAPVGNTVATAKRTTITLSDTKTNKALLVIKAHTDPVTALRYAPNGKLLASGDKKGSVFLFDTASGKQLWKSQFGAAIASLRFPNEGKVLEVTDTAGKTLTLELTTGKVLK